VPASPTGSTWWPRTSSGGGWPALAIVTTAVPSPRSRSSAQTTVHSGSPDWPRSVSLRRETAVLTSPVSSAAVRSVKRASEVRAAASAP